MKGVLCLAVAGWGAMGAVAADYPWRVAVLDDQTAGTGLFPGASCLFTIPGYWDYGHFEPRERCELPGKLFRARAGGEMDARHVYYAPAFWGEVTRYPVPAQPLYAAWQVRAPETGVAGGRFSLVAPLPGPWRVWCNRDADDELRWHLETLKDGQWRETSLPATPDEAGWLRMEVVMEPRRLLLQAEGVEVARVDHDAYAEDFIMSFGSGQASEGGGPVLSEFRETYFHDAPYPYDPKQVPDGPEDLRLQDGALVYMVNPATRREPRHTEGDLIQLGDGRLLLVWSQYYAQKGWDDSPARLAARVSRDGGRTWDEPRVIVPDEHGRNVMSASLGRAGNGDLLLAYLDQLPAMAAPGMVLRRSADDGATWGEPSAVAPPNGNRHIANNACLTTLSSGRLILACREYADGIRRPYCLLSDDDGRTWRAGSHVPDPELTPEQRRGQNVNEPGVAQLADGRLLMTMRTIAGGQFFSYSADEGENWTTPVLSPLRGTCSPAAIRRIPGSDDILAIWTYSYLGRAPLVSAISGDGGRTWHHLKLIEQSPYHVFGYTSITFVGDRVYLTYMHAPGFTSLERFEADPGYIDQRLTVLPLAWFYR